MTDSSSRASTLSGRTVLVTRPAHQAEELCQAIEDVGGHVMRHPVIEISTDISASAKEQLNALSRFNMLIFVSTNAINHCLQALHPVRLPANVPLATIGPASTQALKNQGYEADIQAGSPHDSESLLQHEAMQVVAAQRIGIIRGHGGRPWLGDQLERMGAKVEYIELYSRKIPDISPEPLQQALLNGEVDIVSVTSNQALRNLITISGEAAKPALLGLPLTVLSERTRELAVELGFSGSITVSQRADVKAIVDALLTSSHS